MTDQDPILRRATERLLEDESLTADLIDDAAQLLLDWGVTQTRAVVRQSEESSAEEIDSCLANLRHTLKRISKEAGKVEPRAQAKLVQALLSEIGFEEQEPEVDECGTNHTEQPCS